MPITAEQLAYLGIDGQWVDALNVTFERFSIDTPFRQACFIGQCSHESGGFRRLAENMNYSAQGLRATWPARFPTVESAEPYHRQPEKIASKVYAGRMGNGDEASGDGWKYRGRGLIQLSGKANYQQAGEALGADLLGDPEQVAQPLLAALSAGWFWERHQLNALADLLDHEAITRKINGGTHGLDDRIQRSEAALMVLEVAQQPAAEEPAAQQPATPSEGSAAESPER